MSERKDDVVFTPEELMKSFLKKENEQRSIIWDDAGLWLHKPDTIEKIIEDAVKMVRDFNEAIEVPDLMWTSAYSSLRKMHIRNVFLMKLTIILSRIDRVTKEKKK